MEIIIFLPVLFFSIVLHEFAHGYAAYRLGDNTAYYSGRLTLNPIKHVDPVGTLAVPLFCYIMGFPLFGWARPVPVNPMKFPSPRRDMGKVALAGPLTNLALAIVCVLVMKVLLIFRQQIPYSTLETLFSLLQYGMTINVILAVFNLMPIAPLDGGRIVAALLPLKAAYIYDAFLARWGMWVVIGLVATGSVKYILFPPASFIVGLFSKFLM